RIVIVSDDVNLRQRAEQLGFDAIEPPERYERAAEADPRDTTIEQLQKKIQQYQDTRPKLSLSFANGSQELQVPPLRSIDPEKLESDYMTELFHARSLVSENEIVGSEEQTQRRATDMGHWLQQWQDATRQQCRAEAALARTFHTELR